jgi:hypothetical protein
MSGTRKVQKKTNGTGAASAGAAAQTVKFVNDDVAFLFKDLTTPESGVTFDPPARATTATINNTIDPPAATWTWDNQAARTLEPVNQNDLGKFGYQKDIQTLFKLVATSPRASWQAVQDFSKATWTWANQAARLAQPVTQADLSKVGYQTNTNQFFQLTSISPSVWTEVPDPTAANPGPFELSKGASDADSFHDFFRLQIAFEDVWVELLDTRIQKVGQQLYASFDALLDNSQAAYDDSGKADRQKHFSELQPFDPATGLPDISGIAQLQNFLENIASVLGLPPQSAIDPVNVAVSTELAALKTAVAQTLSGCTMLLLELNRVGSGGGNLGHVPWDSTNWLNATRQQPDDPNAPADLADPLDPSWHRREVFDKIAQQLGSVSPPPPMSDGTAPVTLPDVTGLFKELNDLLRERYRFDVFAPASINYGLLLNYRQHWRPQSYQVGNLVSTIPLAPQETRRYTSKTVIKRSRNVKEISDSLRANKRETSETLRADAEIVDRAKAQTNFQMNAHGSYGSDDLYKVEAGSQFQNDQGVESAQTRRDFREAVLKAAQEYRNETKVEITTEESREQETTTYQELRNPNDELTVTYLFYELQRRYIVDESLYRATPVIFVANDVPAPHEIDQGWLLRHDWIIKRAILDDSFLPALEYLATNYTGEEVTLLTLELAVQHQKSVVDKLSQQVLLANQSLDSATVGLTDAQNQDINNLKTAETVALVKSVFDPLSLAGAQKVDDGNSDRARIDFAKDALNRAQAKVNELTGDLKTELTALQVATDKYTAAATRHFGMLADIDRLRLHVKDNILHYMQAIWSYEPSDQRFYRLYNLDVPVFAQNGAVSVAAAKGIGSLTLKGPSSNISFPPPTLLGTTMKLHQVADLDTLLGFKGNYMIFPLTNFDNYMAWYLVHNYITFDPLAGVLAKEPDPLANLTTTDLQTAMAEIYSKDPASFAANEADFAEAMLRLLSDETPNLVILPSNSLYIEALPGTHPLLEDFKLIHRALDVKKTQAEVRKAELENLRLAARLENAEFGDPDIDKVVVVGNKQGVTVDAGQ